MKTIRYGLFSLVTLLPLVPACSCSGDPAIITGTIGPKEEHEINCGCVAEFDIIAQFVGAPETSTFNFPSCLPPDLNTATASPSQRAAIEALPKAQYEAAVTAFCTERIRDAVTAVLGRLNSDVCGHFDVECAPSVVTGTKATMVNDTCDMPCATVVCDPKINCIAEDVFDVPTGKVDTGACACTQTSGCNITTEFFCDRTAGNAGGGSGAPFGPNSPPTLLSGDFNTTGRLTTLLSSPTIITLDHAQSQADVTLNVDVELTTVTDTQHPHVGGRVTLYGRPSPGAPTDMLLDLSLFPDDITFDLGAVIGSHSVTRLSIVGGVGTIPVHIDANGDGLIPMNTLQFTADGVLDGADRRQYRSANAFPIPFHVDFVNKTFSLQGLTANFADGSATINLSGTIQNFPPLADAGPNQTVECTSPDGASVGLDASGSSDLDGNIMRTTWWKGAALDPDAFLSLGSMITTTAPLGTTEYQFSISDQSFLTDAAATTITVVDTTAPLVNAPPDVVVECTAANGQAIDIGNATVNEACDSAPELISDAPSQYLVGTTPIHWAAADASGNTGYATQHVTVQDTTPPSLSLSVTPSQIWPPNKIYVPVTISALASDICSGAVSVTLISATATEPGGSQVVPTSAIQGAQIGTADFQFLVQADRTGNAPSGRVYTFTYDAVDANGNHTNKSVTVTVPHSSP